MRLLRWIFIAIVAILLSLTLWVRSDLWSQDSSISLGFRDHHIPPVFTFASVGESLEMTNVEMSSLCQALKDAPELIWIALQNEENKTQVAQELLERCKIKSLYLKARTISPNQITLSHQRRRLPTIFAVTPTFKRLSQKVDLTDLCQTLISVPELLWIVVENSETKSKMVTSLLQHCKVSSVHLNIPSLPDEWSSVPARGIEPRNYGLEWVRSYCGIMEKVRPCSGVLYFMDDDNKYDLRLFDQLRKTKAVSAFPVAFSGGLKVEGPLCKGEKVVDWHTVVALRRKIPIDMAGFAINVRKVLEKPKVWFGYRPNGERISRGELESRFLEHFADDKLQLECRGSETEVYVWHVKVEFEDPQVLKETRDSAPYLEY